MYKDISGKKYGKLTAIKIAGKNSKNIIQWLWKCDCGTEKIMIAASIKAGKVVSCGCYNREHCYRKVVHGMWGTVEYKSWLSMRKRVLGKEKRYSEYKKLGIDEIWKNSFQEFYNHIKKAPTDKHTVDRIDNNKGYYPGNVRWATRKEQNRNYSQNKLIEYRGEIKSVTDWAEELGKDRHLIYNRLKRGLSPQEAIEKPKQVQIKKTTTDKNI